TRGRPSRPPYACRSRSQFRGCISACRNVEMMRDTGTVTTNRESFDALGLEARVRAEQAQARSVALAMRAVEARDSARGRADRARAEATAAHIRAARLEDRAADRGVGNVSEHRRRAAEHRMAALKAGLTIDSTLSNAVHGSAAVTLSALARRRT